MFSKKFFVSVLLALATVTEAAAVPGLDKRSDGFLALDFAVHRNSNVSAAALNHGVIQKRGDYPVTLTGEQQIYYIADLYFGSNKQKISVDIDTGSSDLWVIDSESGVTGKYGTYNHGQSSSYKSTSTPFAITYLDKSHAEGNYVKDSVSLSENGPTIKAQEFGDATDVAGLSYGIFGVGPVGNEATSSTYDNVPLSLKKQGFISKNAYSIYLDSLESQSGTIVFGGIDTAKYTGELQQLEVLDDNFFSVTLDSWGANGKKIDGTSIILDTGSTTASLTPDNLKQVAALVGAGNYNEGDDNHNAFYYWDNENQIPETLDLTFGSVTISLPQNEFAVYDETNDGNKVASLFISPEPDNILGDTFLRHAYTVYNIDDKWVKLGNVKYTSDSKVEPIT